MLTTQMMNVFKSLLTAVLTRFLILSSVIHYMTYSMKMKSADTSDLY